MPILTTSQSVLFAIGCFIAAGVWIWMSDKLIKKTTRPSKKVHFRTDRGRELSEELEKILGGFDRK